MLSTVAAVLHCEQILIGGPGDGEEECGGLEGFDFVADGGAEGDEVSFLEVMGFAMNGETYLPLEYVDGEGSVGVMLLHHGFVFHDDEEDSEVVLLEEGLGVVAGLPRLLLLGVGDLLVKVKLRQLVDHGAVFKGGGHLVLLSASNNYAL
jgi:hypothetical protein